ncbi:MAG: CocE/NonD family hydrolase [Deltaproteobacteria bacterium]|nr:CocE/NonD family hydrolase [Deltaproteobacteria bacterium]
MRTPARAATRALSRTLVLASLLALAACGNDRKSTPPTGPTPSPGPTSSPAPVAEYEAHGSVEQVWLRDATPGTELRLVDASGAVAQTGTADAQGTLIFRNVAAGTYRVAAGSGGEARSSDEIRVTTADEAPPQSLYDEQDIGPGYGYLETRDGTLLAINVILPGPPEGAPYPTLIEYSGYDPANADTPQPSTLIGVALGYAVVGVNMRGTGCSGGAFQFFETLQTTDGYDAVEAIAAQPWVKDHDVGMIGISYPGISQLFTAWRRPPSLIAIAPLSVVSDTGRGTLFPGGILNNGFAVAWAEGRRNDAMPGGQPWSQKRMDEGDEVCIDNQILRGQTPDILEMIDDNRFYVPEVADPVSPYTFVQNIDVPVYLAGAWQDEQTGGYFPTMLDRFTGTDRVHFTMTNGGHTDSLGPVVFTRWMEFIDLYVGKRIPKRPATVPLITDVLAGDIFRVEDLPLEPERYDDVSSLEEALARFEAEKPVRVLFENGAGADPGAPYPSFEMSFDAWPIPEVQATTWYLTEDGRLSPEEPTSDGADGFLHDTSLSQKTTLASGSPWEALPGWDWTARAPGTFLAYTTDELEEDMVFVGSGSVDLWFESTATDTDVQVTLAEVRPDGNEVLVQNGWLRASRRVLDEAVSTELRPVSTHREADAAELPAGEPALLRVEIFPFAHPFRAGSRIRLYVETPGGTRPEWRWETLEFDGEVTNTIERSAAHPSRVVLPLVPSVEIPTPLPACPSLRGQPCRPDPLA